MTSMPYMPAPMPPGVISPSSMLNSGTRPAIGWTLSCHGVDGARARAGRHGREQAADGGAEAGLLALHVAEWPGRRPPGRAGCRRTRGAWRATAPTRRIDRHRGEDRPALALVAGVLAERVGQRERRQQDREHLEPVGQRGRVLERMGRVGVEEAAAVVAQLLDPFLGGDGAKAIVWRAPWSVVTVGRAAPRLRHALPHEDERADDGDRQQDVEDAPGQVDPVVAERLRAAPGQAAEQRDGDGQAGRGGGEVADGEHGRLGQVAGAGLARVVLPVRVRLEADRRVEGEIGRHRPGRRSG